MTQQPALAGLTQRHLGVMDIAAVTDEIDTIHQEAVEAQKTPESLLAYDFKTSGKKLTALIAIAEYVNQRVFKQKTPNEAVQETLKKVTA